MQDNDHLGQQLSKIATAVGTSVDTIKMAVENQQLQTIIAELVVNLTNATQTDYYLENIEAYCRTASAIDQEHTVAKVLEEGQRRIAYLENVLANGTPITDEVLHHVLSLGLVIYANTLDAKAKDLSNDGWEEAVAVERESTHARQFADLIAAGDWIDSFEFLPIIPNPDDIASQRFNMACRAKLASKRAQGYGGWGDPACTNESLATMLVEHVMKGDPVDIANFCMFLHQRKAPGNVIHDAFVRHSKQLNERETEFIKESIRQHCGGELPDCQEDIFQTDRFQIGAASVLDDICTLFGIYQGIDKSN